MNPLNQLRTALAEPRQASTSRTPLTLDQFREAFPVGRSFHAGGYGWRRYADCLNLHTCSWRTEGEAEVDRDQHYEDYLVNPDRYGFCR